MSDSDSSKKFDPEKTIEQRESSGVIDTLSEKVFSRIGLSYLIAFIISVVTFMILGDIVAEAMYPLPELPVGPGDQGFETAQEIDDRYRNHALVQQLFFYAGLIVGPLAWYSYRKKKSI